MSQLEKVILYKATSIIQRDAILAALAEAGISAETSPRDISRQLSDTTLDLSHSAYSVTFDGFPIIVETKDSDEALRVIHKFIEMSDASVVAALNGGEPVDGEYGGGEPSRGGELDKTQGDGTTDENAPTAKRYWRRVYLSCLFCLVLPLLMHAVAAYNFYLAVQSNQRPNRLYLSVAAMLWITSLVVLVVGILY